jgi:hypothetical protein
VGIALSLPFVQTKIAQHLQINNKDFGTNISIDAVRLSVFGGKVQKCFNTGSS